MSRRARLFLALTAPQLFVRGLSGHRRIAAAWNSGPSAIHSAWRILSLLANIHTMPRPDLLETFPNPYPGRDYEIYMECAEFTSLCPVGGIETDAAELEKLRGGAPDFGTIRITYVPDKLCLELKALKLYLWSFRDDGIFYERAVNRILDDLMNACSPARMEVVGDFNVRGGIKSIVTARAVGAQRTAQSPKRSTQPRGKAR